MKFSASPKVDGIRGDVTVRSRLTACRWKSRVGALETVENASSRESRGEEKEVHASRGVSDGFNRECV